MLLCSSMANIFGSSLWKPEIANHSQAFAAATWTLCYREGLDYYRIVVLFDCYQRQCIKTMKRSRRSKNIPQIVGRVITGRGVPVASISCTRRQRSALNTVSLRWTCRTSSGWHYNRRIWWLFKLKAIFLSDPILDVAVLKSNQEEAERKLCSPCNHF